MVDVGSSSRPEQRTFIDGGVKYGEPPGCCEAARTKRCCLATGGLGAVILLLGLLLMVAGRGLLEGAVLKSMALGEGSDRTATWLTPETMNIQAHLTGYGFHVTNPEAVARGEKPVLQEVGPFIYQALTIKDTRASDGTSHLKYSEDGKTLTYSPRRFYFLDRELSTGGNPDTTYLTVPNIPLLTGFHKIRGMGFGKGFASNLVIDSGIGTPFINVSFTDLLWGYYDGMPCFNLDYPSDCPARHEDVELDFESDDWGDDQDDDWGDDEENEVEEETEEGEDDGWGWGRKKSELPKEESDMSRVKRESVKKWRKGTQPGEDVVAKVEHFRQASYEDVQAQWKPKMEWLKEKDEDGKVTSCNCEWGLFRDRNITVRKPIKMHHGVGDVSLKGRIEEYDNSPNLNWWQEGSTCDHVAGAQDGATLPPGVSSKEDLNIFIALMCRKITLKYEEDREYKGLTAHRFIPPSNALGSHRDTDPDLGNPDNQCYCMEDGGRGVSKEHKFPCFKSGVMNMGPCKASEGLPAGAPIALSSPHFYQADPSFREAVVGMEPNKTKHQMFVDIHPRFGYPLAFRPKFQLNAVIRRDPDIPLMSQFPEELVLPFLWAQDGFGEPSDEMAAAIHKGEFAIDKLPLLGGSVLLVVGGAMLLAALSWAVWRRRHSPTPT